MGSSGFFFVPICWEIYEPFLDAREAGICIAKISEIEDFDWAGFPLPNRYQMCSVVGV